MSADPSAVASPELVHDAHRMLLACDWVVPHTDADGLAAGALALRAREEGEDRAVLLRRGETPFGKNPPLPEGSVAVLDWGVRDLARPGLLIDHHAPESRPRPGQVVVSGYGEVPEVSTSILVARVTGGPAWLAAVGAVGDLGRSARALPEVAESPKTSVSRLAALVNAPRRLPDGPVREALGILVDAEDPKAALADDRVALLEDAKSQWRGAFEEAMKVAPEVDRGVAHIRLASRYQIHPVVAAVWMRRLRPNLVLVSNSDYLPGRVNFAVRGGEGDLRVALKRALPEAGGEFAHGHDRATGGSLEPEHLETLIERLRENPA